MQDGNHRYAEAIAAYGASLSRLARGYEADPDRRADLLQEIHIALWRSFAAFGGRCSLRTWVYRIAHNVAASHIVRSRRASARLVDLDALQTEPAFFGAEAQAGGNHAAARLLHLIHKLAPVDRQTILLYLEGERAESIAEVTGLSAVNVATKIHRIKKLLNASFRKENPMPEGEAETNYESLWKNQEEEKVRMTMDEVCVKARAFERKTVREYWLVLGVLALFIGKTCFYFYQFPSPLSRVGFTFGIAIFLYIALRWARNGPPKKLAALATPHPCVRFMRAELERKREAILEIRWTLFLLLPAMLASWWAGTPVAIAKSLGIDSPWYVRFQQSPAPLILFTLLLVAFWRGFGKEARRIALEIEKLPGD